MRTSIAHLDRSGPAVLQIGDVSGRPQVLLMLERLIGHLNQHEGVKWVTMEEAADDFRRRQPFKG